MNVDRSDNLKLLVEYVDSIALKRHMYAVEAAVVAYAKKFDADVELGDQRHCCTTLITNDA